jgi:hypothetical protein
MSPSSITRYIIAGLGAAASASAFPATGQSSPPSAPPPSAFPAAGPYSSSSSSSSSSSTSTPLPNTLFTLPSITQPSTPPPATNTAAAASAAASIAALAKSLLADVTNVDRFNDLLTVNGAGLELLSGPALADRLIFDFGAKALPVGAGGRIALANEDNFPILVGQGLSTAVAFLEPCGLNSPHTHPRATEFLTVVQGALQNGFMLENGFVADKADGALTTQVTTNLTAFQSTIFPQGSIHFQFNDHCEPATFVSTLNSADPGTSQVAQNFFFLDGRIVDATLGKDAGLVNGGNLDAFRDALPPNLVQAMDGCLARCGHGRGQ